VKRVAKFCSECGSALESADEFCGHCGKRIEAAGAAEPAERTQPQPAVTASPPPPPPPPPSPAAGGGWWSNGRHVALAAGGASLLIIGVVVALALITGRGGTTHQEVNAGASQPTTTTVDPAAVKAEQDYAGYVTRIENIVQQSTSGRGQVGALVAGVENGCQTSPFNASQQIRTVMDNRTSVLNQLSGLSAAPNAEAQNFSSLLQQALQSSINADAQYKGWMDYLYADFYYTYPVGCPGGAPLKNAAYNAARAADTQSTSLKEQFAAAFNPVATRFSQPTWQASDF
jgi:hypothetical protein